MIADRIGQEEKGRTTYFYDARMLCASKSINKKNQQTFRWIITNIPPFPEKRVHSHSFLFLQWHSHDISLFTLSSHSDLSHARKAHLWLLYANLSLESTTLSLVLCSYSFVRLKRCCGNKKYTDGHFDNKCVDLKTYIYIYMLELFTHISSSSLLSISRSLTRLKLKQMITLQLVRFS